MSITEYIKYSLLFLILFILILLMLIIGPIPQNPSYHHFSDQRTIFFTPNTIIVLSNLPFIIIGGIGMVLLKINKNLFFIEKTEQLCYWFLFLSIFLVGIGSGLYHIDPNNFTLFIDRIPVAMIIMSFLSAMIAERINTRMGVLLLGPLIIIGILSVFIWIHTESLGHGDMRLYLIIQAYTAIIIPLLLLFFDSNYTKAYYIWFAYLFYILARLFEIYDHGVYQLTYQMISGHALKHISAAISALLILIYIMKRTKA